MNAKIESISNKLDWLKWSFLIAIFAAGMAFNYLFAAIPTPIRIIGWVVVFAVMLGFAAWTSQGRIVVGFLGDARTELRKVVWPTMQETVQTTGMIVLMVVIFGLLMWGFDTLIMLGIRYVVGQA